MIYLSVPSTRQNLTLGLFLKVVVCEGEVAHESRLWSTQVIGSVGAMWTILVIVKSPGSKPGDLARHRRIRPEFLAQCESLLAIVATRHECKAASWTQFPVWTQKIHFQFGDRKWANEFTNNWLIDQFIDFVP